ncbi:MAG TPA: ATP-grasp domain-containing protein, partial [Quisquiliibacterium sp.]|nr:ATP-grasp domain-containing protein [Quisquiliibacterium sp.]
SRDKDLTKELLRQCGVPTPEGRIVHGRDEAWSAAQDIGMPVVVKPSDGNHGRGVFVNLDNREEILSAYDVAATQGSAVIVERFIPGNEHRLLIVGNKLAAAAKGESAYVVGDGRSTILELIEVQLNSDPLRGEHGSTPLNLVRLDSMNRIEIERQGFAPDSIPPAGHSVLIQRHGNVVWEITDRVHPSTAATAALAARIVGLDIAGIDLVVEDISRPLAEQGGAIVEVNAGPGLHMHIVPAGGKPQPVGDIIARHLFPNGDRGRIPIVGITGNGGNTGIARIVAHLLQLAGNRVGLACRDGLFTNRRTIETTDCANWPSAHRVLINRAVDAGVFENGPWTMAAEGLAYDRCLVGVVTGMDPELRIPECHIETEDHVFKVLRTQVDIVLREGTAVLNADDPRVLEMVELSEGQVMLYSGRADNDAIRAHCAAGGRAMFARDGVVLLADATGETALGRISSFPCVMQDPAKYSAETVVAAIAAAVALGITPDLVRAGLAHFDPDRQFSPPPAALATVAAALREGGR